MAATADKFKTSLILEYSIGQNEDGKDIIRRQKFSSIKIDALDDDLFQIANAFSPLLEHEVISLKKQDDSVILDY
ncbi:DUF1659 domain-containing protein [uncultured Clostridium sp.]|uniref:DUF1659 domain-containing protein n=1 Tax=uncultured Clostridium sp. TaxID=59620 RepID=UPI0028E6BA20|nr:DUF1659 domain-containing protein [uncultured Clostridium sp.]